MIHETRDALFGLITRTIQIPDADRLRLSKLKQDIERLYNARLREALTAEQIGHLRTLKMLCPQPNPEDRLCGTSVHLSPANPVLAPPTGSLSDLLDTAAPDRPREHDRPLLEAQALLVADTSNVMSKLTARQSLYYDLIHAAENLEEVQSVWPAAREITATPTTLEERMGVERYRALVEDIKNTCKTPQPDV